MNTERIDELRPSGSRRRQAEHMFRSAHSLMLNTLLGATLGLVFWLAAARLYSSETVGRDSALIASMLSLSALCTLNLHNVLLRFLPTRRRQPARAVLVAYGIAAAVTALGAGALVVLMPAVSDQFRVLRTNPALSVLYVVAAVSWTVFALQDAALTAMRHAAWVPIKNTLYGALKLGVLALLAVVGSDHGILVAWIAPLIAMLVPVNYLMFRRLLPEHSRRGQDLATETPSIGRTQFLRFAAQDSAGGALNMAALTLLPLLVVVLLGTTANAHFFIPFTIVVTFDLLFLNVAASLVAEGARDEVRIPALVHSIVRRFLPPLLLGVAVLAAAAPLILAPFGADYAREGTAVLRLMALASIFRAVMALFVAVSRLRHRGGAILLAHTAFSVLLVALVVVLADPMGIGGIAFGWLLATAVVALSVTPSLVRFVRTSPTMVRNLSALSGSDAARPPSAL